MRNGYTYETAIRNSEKVSWRVEDILGGKSFDFSRSFLPEGLAGVKAIGFLSEGERRKLNQIRACTYAHLFQFVEEFIIAQVLSQAARHQFGDAIAMRALLRFTEEELKHQELFRETIRIFDAGFGSAVGRIPGARDVAKLVMSNPPMAVMMLTDMLEWMTQWHYLELFEDGKASLDPTFVSVLKAHWTEEAQHAKLDGIEIRAMAEKTSLSERESAVDQLLAIGGAFDGLLLQQVQLDVKSLEQAIGRQLSPAECDELVAKQHKAYRYTFLVSGLRHKEFQELVGELTENGVGKLNAAADALSA
jgi:hypothetical protein